MPCRMRTKYRAGMMRVTCWITHGMFSMENTTPDSRNAGRKLEIRLTW